MAITVGETTVNGNASTASLAVNKPADLAVGNVLVARVALDDNSGITITPPTGFSQVITTNLSGVAGTGRSVIYTKTATSSDVAASSFTFGFSGGTSVLLSMTRVILAKTVSTVAASNGQANNASATANTSGVTPAEAGSLIMIFTFFDDVNTGSVASYALTTSSPTFTEAYDATNTWSKVSMAYGIRPETTATGDASAVLSGAGTPDNICQVIAITPAQTFSVSDSVTSTDTVTARRDLLLSVSDTVTPADSVDADINTTVITNTPKTAAPSWVNTPKS